MQTSVMTIDAGEPSEGRLGDLLRRGDADDDAVLDGLGPHGFSAVSTRQG